MSPAAFRLGLERVAIEAPSLENFTRFCEGNQLKLLPDEAAVSAPAARTLFLPLDRDSLPRGDGAGYPEFAYCWGRRGESCRYYLGGCGVCNLNAPSMPLGARFVVGTALGAAEGR